MGLSMDVLALLSGVLIGFVLGLIGGGGSVFAAPLLVYFVSGRWFVRGITAGAVKG